MLQRFSKNKIVSESFYVTIDQIFQAIFGFILSILLARLFGPEGTGIYYIAVSLPSLIAVFATFGVRGILLREIVKKPFKSSFYLSTIFSIYLFFSLPLIVIFSLLAVFVLPFENNVIYNVFLSSIYVSLMQFFMTLLLFFIYNQKSKVSFILNFLYKSFFLLAAFFCSVVIFRVKKTEILFFIHIFSLFIFLLLALKIIYKSDIYIKVFFHLKWFKKVMYISFPLILGSAAEFVNFRIDNIMLGAIKSENDSGIYSIAYNIYISTLLVPIAILKVYISNFIQQYKKGIFFGRNFFKKFFLYLSFYNFFMLIILVVISDYFVFYVYGEEFLKSGNLLKILAICIPFIVLNRLNNYTLIALGHQSYYAIISLIGSFINIILNLIFIPLYSYYGAALTTIITELFVFLLGLLKLRRLLWNLQK